MADEKNPISEPLQRTAQAAQTVRGAVKLGKSIAAAAKGAAAGGVWGAIASFAWENRRFLTKVVIAATVVLLIPIILICMLPSIIFGGLDSAYDSSEASIPILNDNTVIESNLNTISETVNEVMSEALNKTLKAIEEDYESCTADGIEIINPYSDSSHINVNVFIGQYCAYKNADYTSASIADMEAIFRNGEHKLYSYTKKEETHTVSDTSDDESDEEEDTETWIVYTVVYNGDAYFADKVFKLTEEQKELATDYADNLTLFLAG